MLLNLTPTPKITHWDPKTPKNGPKIKSKLKVRIQESIEKESCLALWLDPKNVFEPYLSPKNSPLGPKKLMKDPKITFKLEVRINRIIENKSIQIYE